jgi:hypothetical protein
MQNKIEAMGRIGEKGTLNGRFKSGRVFLKMITDAEAAARGKGDRLLFLI